MFVAKFNQTSGAPFTTDKNGNYPFIGTILAGKTAAAIINGTIFQRDDLEVNTLYLCDSVEREYEGKIQHDVQVISKVDTLEFMSLRTKLGAGELVKTVKTDVAKTAFETLMETVVETETATVPET